MYLKHTYVLYSPIFPTLYLPNENHPSKQEQKNLTRLATKDGRVDFTDPETPAIAKFTLFLHTKLLCSFNKRNWHD